MRIPRDAPLGSRDLTLVGTNADGAGAAAPPDILDLGGGDTPDAGPRDVASLAREIAHIHRYDGVRMELRSPGTHGASRRAAFRDPSLRISGTASASVLVEP